MVSFHFWFHHFTAIIIIPCCVLCTLHLPSFECLFTASQPKSSPTHERLIAHNRRYSLTNEYVFNISSLNSELVSIFYQFFFHIFFTLLFHSVFFSMPSFTAYVSYWHGNSFFSVIIVTRLL